MSKAEAAVRLHGEILEFARTAAPDAAESRRKEAALAALRDACAATFGRRCRVEAFGSYVHGISLAGSDLDVVVTGVVEPRDPRAGLAPDEKEAARRWLRELANFLARRRIAARRPLVINSRIPLMKQAEIGGVLCDVSIYSDNGPRAARWLLQQQGESPALKPLTLALKALLADADLADPSRGGLSTWALSNMALALLKKRAHEGLGCEDTGVLLLHFLTYFGDEFDYAGEAVATGRPGGIAPKADLPGAREVLRGNDEARKGRLCVEDPLTGKDIGNLSHAIDRVKAELSAAAKTLERSGSLASLLPMRHRGAAPRQSGAQPVIGGKRPAPETAPAAKALKRPAIIFRPKPKEP